MPDFNQTELEACCNPPQIFPDEFDACTKQNFLKQPNFEKGSEVISGVTISQVFQDLSINFSAFLNVP